MRFERHHSALIVASVVTVASFVAATAYTQSRLARFDSVSSTIETDAVPSIEYLSHAAVSLTRLDQWLDAVATGGPQQASARAAARREVEDSGAGIPGESIRNIFEPFVRRPNAVGSGTGLGLATVKRLVESHGGTVAIRSELGAGSVFAVELPTPPHTASEPI
jgi:hypothetical protein